MSNSLDFYSDSGLSAPFSLLAAAQASDGSTAPVDVVAYLGSPVSAMKFQDAGSPGVSNIVLSVVDSLAGLQVPGTSLRLALSSGSLGAATPGAALSLGTEILSGTGNALAVHVRIDSPAIAAGVYNNLALSTSMTIEVAA